MPAPPPPTAVDVLIVGAGVGGLCAAARLARHGLTVRVLERAAAPGGKLRTVQAGASSFDGGPTVLTMRWVFEELFDQLGLELATQLQIRPCDVLARHAWGGGGQLDLVSDPAANEAAIADLAGGDEALRYRTYARRAEHIYRALEQPFLRGQRPTPWSLAARAGWRGLPGLARIAPFSTLWAALGRHFRDPRLRQLFGRYATYCGSSPFDAPATLMLVSHVERLAVWQVDGGLQALASALAAAAQQCGARIDCGCHVQEIRLAQGRVAGVRLADGRVIDARQVLFNGDAAALQSGLLGTAVQQALGGSSQPAALTRQRAQRSLSAVTWHLEAEASGFDLAHHNVFFSDPGNDGYRREFDAIARGQLPRQPTVYVCAQDRGSTRTERPAPTGTERVMCLVNAPANGDASTHGPKNGNAQGLRPEEIDACFTRMLAHLGRAGLKLRWSPEAVLCTTPQDQAQRYPGTGGALYGAASRGWQASFRRPGSRTAVPGLYLAGGSVHPGPGVPMAALSAQRAVEQILADCRSTRSWHPVAMPGGISTR